MPRWYWAVMVAALTVAMAAPSGTLAAVAAVAAVVMCVPVLIRNTRF